MKMKKTSRPFVKSLITTGLSAMAIALPTHVLASSYQVMNYLSDAVSAGDGAAGGAALANDASTSFTNPAGLVRIPTYQLIAEGNLLAVHTTFRGSNTWSTGLLPPPFNSHTETGKAVGDASVFTNALHFSAPIAPCWRFGLSVVPTYGVSTLYANNSVLRYNSTKSDLRIADISPALAFAINNHFSVGVGVDFARATLIYRAMAGLPTFPPGVSPTANDALSKNTGDAWGYGGHAGVLFQLNPETRFGLHYRSRISLRLEGKSELTGAGAIEFGDVSVNNFRTTLVLPAVTTLSAYHDFNSCWAMDASVNWSQWSHVGSGNQALYNVATPTPVTVTIPWHYRDTWMGAIGAIYKPAPKWILRGGVHYDESPVKSTERYSVLPDANRVGLSAGAHYQIAKCVGFDMGYTHIFVQNASISAPTIVGPQTSTPNGNYRTSADIVAGQIVWDIA